MALGIEIGGRLFPVVDTDGLNLPVRRWNDGEQPIVPEFTPGSGFNKKRIKPIDLFVFHWTGGEQDPLPMAETLRTRKLGVEFAIARDGTIYQFCDPMLVDTADAGIVNSRSAGCEIVCYGYRSLWELRHAFGIPKLGRDRETYEASTHGTTITTAKFYPNQMRAAFALADAFAQAVPAVIRCVPPTNEVMPPEQLVGYTGFIGHDNITDAKRDPGPWFMNQLGQHFANNRAPVLPARPRLIA